LVVKCLVVGIGGFIGANARYLLGMWVQNRWGASFPYGTFVINITGSFILGLFAALTLKYAWNDQWRLLIAVGFVGAYTTFSTFEYESLMLVSEGAWGRALVNIFGSVVLGFVAAMLGVFVARFIGAAHA
jgi:fluoride exporter